MSKAVYIFDMPTCCYDCVFFDDSGDYPYCNATGEQRGYTFRARESKMDKCPLREMPEKVDIENLRTMSLILNVAIDEILGK